ASHQTVEAVTISRTQMGKDFINSVDYVHNKLPSAIKELALKYIYSGLSISELKSKYILTQKENMKNIADIELKEENEEKKKQEDREKEKKRLEACRVLSEEDLTEKLKLISTLADKVDFLKDQLKYRKNFSNIDY